MDSAGSEGDDGEGGKGVWVCGWERWLLGGLVGKWSGKVVLATFDTASSAECPGDCRSTCLQFSHGQR